VKRRDFLRGAASLGAFCGLPRLARAGAVPAADDTLLSLIEDTPRDALVEAVARRIRDGATYPQVVGALLLAGVRNVRPRPVGFKFHAVMVVHACHQAAYAARDFRHIGHKAIYVAGAFRLFELLGWARAEPVLRSLAFALLAREGGDAAERPWARSLELAKSFPGEWRGGKTDDAAGLDVLHACRGGSEDEPPKRVVELLRKGISPISIWDGLHLHAGELLLRRPNILSLHEVTTANATRHLFDTTSDDETRRLLLLQTAAFAPLFRGEKSVAGDKLNELEAVEGDPFEHLPGDRSAAARKALSWAPERLVEVARGHLILKGRDVHDFKFVEAALEDQGKLSPAFRSRYLASSMAWLKGPGSPDNGLVARIRAALR
jgi:hypothetical protein